MNIEVKDDNNIVSSFDLATEESDISRNPIEIEVMPKRYGVAMCNRQRSHRLFGENVFYYAS
jgi:hypothetical protein